MSEPTLTKSGQAINPSALAVDTAAAAAPAPVAVGIPALTGNGATPIATRRLEHTTVCLPIVHGSIAFYLGKKADEFQSHQWTLYLRGPRNEDLSPCIQKVVFHLHASFAQPVREYTQPPFEVTEKGWGEFEAQIRIHWKDPTESMTMVRAFFALHSFVPNFGCRLVAIDAEPGHPWH
jgi:YEATS family